jgi:hypothetical protein
MEACADDQPFASLPNSQKQLRPHEDIVGVLFDGGPCPRKSAAPSRAYGIFGENFCKRVGEFAMEHRNVGNFTHGHLRLC